MTLETTENSRVPAFTSLGWKLHMPRTLGVSIRCIAIAYLSIVTVAVAGPPRQDENDADAFRIYGVHIDRTPKQSWIGLGTYLGGGYVITPAHVAGLGFWQEPRVEVDGRDLPTQVVKDGHFHNLDVTLLSVDEQELPERLRLLHLSLCQNSPWPGEEVVVATRETAVPSHVISPRLLPSNISSQFTALIPFAPESSVSGSGVFDRNKKCLLGIISGKIWQNQFAVENDRLTSVSHDIASYFVPSPVITQFIPPGIGF
jgi:hypothetical protein